MAASRRDLILVLTADAHFGQIFETHLRSNGNEVRRISSVSAVVVALQSHRPNLLLIDRSIPNLRVLFDVEILRKTLHAVVQFPGEECSQDECIEDMEKGFDVVICNQSIRQIIARIRAILRRERMNKPEQLVVGGLSLDPYRHEVKVDGKMVDLTHKEYMILELMMRQPGRAFTRKELLEKIWGVEKIDHHTVDVHIHAIRKKIEASDSQSPLKTVRGFGFRIEALV